MSASLFLIPDMVLVGIVGMKYGVLNVFPFCFDHGYSQIYVFYKLEKMAIVYHKSRMPTYLGTYIIGHYSLRHYSCF